MGRLASVMRCVPLLPAGSVKGARSADRLATDLRVNPIVGVLSACKLAFVLRGCVASRGERAGPNWAGLGALGVAWSMGALIHPDTLIRARPRTDQTILDSGGNDRLDYWPDDHKTPLRESLQSVPAFQGLLCSFPPPYQTDLGSMFTCEYTWLLNHIARSWIVKIGTQQWQARLPNGRSICSTI